MVVVLVPTVSGANDVSNARIRGDWNFLHLACNIVVTEALLVCVCVCVYVCVRVGVCVCACVYVFGTDGHMHMHPQVWGPGGNGKLITH